MKSDDIIRDAYRESLIKGKDISSPQEVFQEPASEISKPGVSHNLLELQKKIAALKRMSDLLQEELKVFNSQAEQAEEFAPGISIGTQTVAKAVDTCTHTVAKTAESGTQTDLDIYSTCNIRYAKYLMAYDKRLTVEAELILLDRLEDRLEILSLTGDAYKMLNKPNPQTGLYGKQYMRPTYYLEIIKEEIKKYTILKEQKQEHPMLTLLEDIRGHLLLDPLLLEHEYIESLENLNSLSKKSLEESTHIHKMIDVLNVCCAGNAWVSKFAPDVRFLAHSSMLLSIHDSCIMSYNLALYQDIAPYPEPMNIDLVGSTYSYITDTEL